MKQTNQFPTEQVTLPSKGIFYPEGSPLKNGSIEMKYMTAKEEDILTNQNYIEKGTVIDKLLKSLIVTPNVNYNDLLIGDKNALLIAARILGYGAEYTFQYSGKDYTIDLTEIEDKPFDESIVTEGKNEFFYTLPTSKIDISFKFLTHNDERKITKELEGLKKYDKVNTRVLSTRMKHMLVSVDGSYESKDIREFVDSRMLARDSRALRNHIKEIQPDVDLKHEFTDGTGNQKVFDIPIGINFFWPDVDV